MKKQIASIVLTTTMIAFSAPLAMAGEHDHHSMGHEEHGHAKSIRATGDVRAIRAGVGKIKLRHDPIPEMDWPEMVMDFRVADKKLLSGLQAGDRVEFSMEKGKVGYTITAINKINK